MTSSLLHIVLSVGAELWKGHWLQLNTLHPNVVLVLSICGKPEQWNSVRGTWSNDQSRSWRSGSQESEDKGSGIWDVRMSEEGLRQEEN
jgi:hypothetical protein